MRSPTRRLALALMAALAWASAGQAAPLTFTGSFTFTPVGTGPQPEVGLAGVAVANTPTSVVLGGNVMTTPTVRVIGITAAPPVTRHQLTGLANDAGTLNLSAPGKLGIQGSFLVQAYGGAVTLVSTPLQAGSATPSGATFPSSRACARASPSPRPRPAAWVSAAHPSW